MKYIIKKTSIWETDNSLWNPNKKTNNNVFHKSIDEYKTSSIDDCVAILKCEIDPVSYELTPENIKKEFGLDIKETGINQIIDYYSYRNNIFYNLIDWLYTTKSGNFHFEIPYENNHFGLRDDPNDYYERQIEYSFDIIVEKD